MIGSGENSAAETPLVDPELQRRVYCLTGVPPEIQAYAMARYSRSRESMLQSIRELDGQRAEKFLNTFYFQYGHRSIADLAHLAMAVENISILAAIHLVDEQLWDGQERSTRYQDFRRSGYVVPTGLLGSLHEATYRQAADGLFQCYERLSAGLLSLLMETVQKPESMDDAQAERTLRARAFDVARYLLPLGTRTSVGQIVSARVLERQVSRLLGSELPEVQEIGRDLRHAAESPSATIEGLDLGPATAPTLVKYTAPSAYGVSVRSELAAVALDVLRHVDYQADSPTVDLLDDEPLLNETASTLLYEFDPVGRSYRQIQRAVADLTEAQKREIVDCSQRGRGPHDEMLRAHQAGHGLKFDLFMDLGSFRDLHRHRRCVQIIQGPRLRHGIDSPADIFQAGLGEAGTQATALQCVFLEGIRAAMAAASHIEGSDPSSLGLGQYIYPLAVRTRALFKMDIAEAAYIIEQRTAPAGHFSYRRVAWDMYRALREREPWMADHIRATNPNLVVDLFNR